MAANSTLKHIFGIQHFIWHWPRVNVAGPHWWQVNFGEGNSLMPSGNKPLPEPVMTKCDNTMKWPDQCVNFLTRWRHSKWPTRFCQISRHFKCKDRQHPHSPWTLFTTSFDLPMSQHYRCHWANCPCSDEHIHWNTKAVTLTVWSSPGALKAIDFTTFNDAYVDKAYKVRRHLQFINWGRW